MEMQFKNEIKKLADVVVWADNWIEEMKIGLTEEEFAEDEEVKAFEAVKKAVLDAMTRHTTYTNALNKDIADKNAEIEKLKEEVKKLNKVIMNKNEMMNTVNGANANLRKEIGDLKEELKSMTKARDVWFDTAGGHSNTIIEQSSTIKKLEEKVKHQKENLDGINKTLDAKTKENERLIAVRNNLEREIEAHEEENARLSEKIKSLREEQKTLVDICNRHKKENDDYAVRVGNLERELNGSYKTWNTDLKNHNKRDMALVDELAKKNEEIKKFKEENSRLNARVKCDTEYWKKSFEAQSVDLADEKKLNESLRKTNDELVDTLNKSNDRIEELKEENFKLSGRVDTDFVNKLIQETDYYKNQERIRTDQLRATESKVEQLYKELEGYKDRDENAKDLLNNNSKEIKELKEENSYLKKESKNKSEMIRKAYVRYVDEACKSREEIMNECYEKLTKDNTGYTGFKQYTLRALEAQEGDEKKTKEFLCDSAEIIFRNKRSEDKRKEETKKELNEAFGVPCGSDAIE